MVTGRMGWLYLTQGLVFSLAGLTLFLSLERAAWFVGFCALFPFWIGISSIVSRLTRRYAIRAERETLALGFHALAADFRKQFSPHWMALARRAGARASIDGAPALQTALGSVLGAFCFLLVVPGLGAALVWLGAAFFGLAEKRRLRFRMHRKRVMEEQRQYLCQGLSESLGGTRTFLSLGAERFADRLLSERLDRFEKIAAQTARGDAWQEMAVSAAVPTVSLYLLGLLLRGDAPQMAGLVFMAAILFFQAHRLAFAWVKVAHTRVPTVGESSARSIVQNAEEGRICSLSVGDLFVGENRQLIGPVHFQLKRGGECVLQEPDRADAQRLLTALSGLEPVRSGWLRALDAHDQVVWEQNLARAPMLPRAWFAYLERHPLFFAGSVRENLAFGNPQRWTDARIWRVLEELGAAELVEEFGGLDGQLPWKQCDRTEILVLALARAVLPGRPFLAVEHPGYVGEMEFLREKVARLSEPPGMLVTMPMPPVLSTVEKLRHHEKSVPAFS